MRIVHEKVFLFEIVSDKFVLFVDCFSYVYDGKPFLSQPARHYLWNIEFVVDCVREHSPQIFHVTVQKLVLFDKHLRKKE